MTQTPAAQGPRPKAGPEVQQPARFKTKTIRQRMERDRKMLADYERLMAEPGAMSTPVWESLAKRYHFNSLRGVQIALQRARKLEV